MPNLGGGELLVIMVIVMILFGAGRLPSVMSDAGKSIREFRSALKDGDDGGV